MARRIPPELAVLLLAGLLVRVWFTLSYRPGFLGYPDSASYLSATHGELFTAAYRPGGYPLFMRAIHWLSNDLSAVIVVQHALGMATGVLVYMTARRLGAGRWTALFPAAVVLLGGLQIVLEHSVLSEPLFIFLAAAAAYAGARARESDRAAAWLAGAGLITGAAATVRPVAMFLLPGLVLWALLLGPAVRVRLLHAAAVAATALVVVAGYSAAQQHTTGKFGLTRANGVTLYSRAAPFADCSKFDPPKGTEVFCERTPPDERLGPGDYLNNHELPLLERYGSMPAPPPGAPQSAYDYPAGELAGRWARAAILHQPGAYAKSIWLVLANTVVPPRGERGRPRLGTHGVGFENVDVTLGTILSTRSGTATEDAALAQVIPYWDTQGFKRSHVSALESYARHVGNLEGLPTLVLTLLALAGLGWGRGRARTGSLLPLMFAAGLLVGPAATIHLTARYEAPAWPSLALAAALGASALAARRAAATSP